MEQLHNQMCHHLQAYLLDLVIKLLLVLRCARLLFNIIIFTIPNNDYKGRMQYKHSSSQFECYVGGFGTAKLVLNSTYLTDGGTTVSTSDRRLQFNDQPLTDALEVINRSELVEYDPTCDLADQY